MASPLRSVSPQAPRATSRQPASAELTTLYDPAGPRRKVAVLVETSKAFGRGILRGVRRYLDKQQNWSLWIEERGLDDPPLPWLHDWDGDGIITRTKDLAFAEALLAKGIPIVHVRQSLPELQLPRIYVDDEAVGKMAAEHLLERGFRHFGYCGWTHRSWTQLRCQSFAAAVKAAGGSFDVSPPIDQQARADWTEQQRRMVSWIQSLPHPVGIMASHDAVGIKVLSACSAARFAVPEQVAVIAVDNDELLCDLSDPPMSSVQLDLEQMGYDAAELLDRLIHGASAPDEPRTFAPLGVTTRLSTDVVAISDPKVAQACEYIRHRLRRTAS